MTPYFVDQTTLSAFLTRLRTAFPRPGRLYLVGETSQVYEGWSPWTEQLTYTPEVAPRDRAALEKAVRRAASELGITVLEESPADLIPLPDGYMARARPAGPQAGEGPADGLQVYHFDPYSVAFRYIARGDETDYHLVLALLHHGWMTMDRMDAMLDGLLPRFTSQTIQQDPAEFRRKYKGLLQMWQAIRPGQMHRPTPA